MNLPKQYKWLDNELGPKILKESLKLLNIGRDKFFGILRVNHLLIATKRSYHFTTNSHHRFRKHKNMILDYQITKPNQVWVADLNYIGNRADPDYLSLITDAFSTKIVDITLQTVRVRKVF